MFRKDKGRTVFTELVRRFLGIYGKIRGIEVYIPMTIDCCVYSRFCVFIVDK